MAILYIVILHSGVNSRVNWEVHSGGWSVSVVNSKLDSRCRSVLNCVPKWMRFATRAKIPAARQVNLHVHELCSERLKYCSPNARLQSYDVQYCTRHADGSGMAARKPTASKAHICLKSLKSKPPPGSGEGICFGSLEA